MPQSPEDTSNKSRLTPEKIETKWERILAKHREASKRPIDKQAVKDFEMKLQTFTPEDYFRRFNT